MFVFSVIILSSLISVLSKPFCKKTFYEIPQNLSQGFKANRSGARNATEAIVSQFDVRTPGIDTTARALSGGNQQKLVIGREIAADPLLLIAAHPTRGIDVGAQAAVWEELRRVRAKGLSVLLISADLHELIGLADRLVVMLGGKVVAKLDPADTTPRLLGSHMTGADVDNGEPAQ